MELYRLNFMYYYYISLYKKSFFNTLLLASFLFFCLLISCEDPSLSTSSPISTNDMMTENIDNIGGSAMAQTHFKDGLAPQLRIEDYLDRGDLDFSISNDLDEALNDQVNDMYADAMYADAMYDQRVDAVDQMSESLMETCTPNAEFCSEISEWSEGDLTHYPIVLVHGFLGWDEVLWIDYFYQVPQSLHQAGVSVYVAELDPVAHSEIRSAQLAEFVDRVLACSCSEKINIIAHSQGGIDARFLIGPLGYQDRIASITTISTPHHGFELADNALANLPIGIQFMQWFSSIFSWLTQNDGYSDAALRASLASMSIVERNAYNAMWTGSEMIPIYSYAGFTNPLSDGGLSCQRGIYAGQRGDLTEAALILSYQLTGGLTRPNDGLIPVDSAIWGEFLGCIPADHFDQIGQILGLSDFDHQSFYIQHANLLRVYGH
jgi:triacylglycerol esterase/lipase EstA (alpha/beta hydrolase family)